MGRLDVERHDSSNVRGASPMPNVKHERAAREGTGEDFVEFLLTGAKVKGEFHCAECGYGVTICRALPVCPMCGNESWEQTAWSPFGRAQALQ